MKNRAVKPMAGPKGYSLSIIVDAFSSLLTTCNFGLHVIRQYDDWTQPQKLGHFVGALNIEAFVPKKEFEERIVQMFNEIKSIPPAEGFKGVLIPGELESLRKAERTKNGIPLGAQVAAELQPEGSPLVLGARGVEVGQREQGAAEALEAGLPRLPELFGRLVQPLGGNAAVAGGVVETELPPALAPVLDLHPP